MSVLARSAVPGVPSETTDLPASELAKDAPIPELASKLGAWGYQGGRQRTFQGQSRRLTLVVSRSLAFDDHLGASAFATFVRANAPMYFGTGVEVHPLVTRNRSGWEFVPPACACHMANPEEVGVVVAGSAASWLEIDGPDATKPLLVRLLDPRRNVAIP
ncbi:MAG: hypothetical protein ACJ76P_10475 [Actinomycetota bacterium]